MNRLALLIAAVVATLGAALVTVYLRRFEQDASGGERIGLLTALKPIEAGAIVTDDLLATRLVPRAYVEDRAVLAKDRAKVVGLRMGQAVQPQQTLMWTDLAIAMEERRNLSSLIQPGMRAVTVTAASRGDKAYALIHPGDRLDVIAVLPTAEKAQEKNASVVLLQNVLVLAVGIDTGGEPAAEKGANDRKELLLSLSVTVPEAQLLALATEKGKLQVALRNPDDVRVTEGIADVTAAALVDVVQRSVVQNVRKTQTVSPVDLGRPKGVGER